MTSALHQRRLSIGRAAPVSLVARRQGVDLALRRFCERTDAPMLLVRHVFAAALRAALLGALDEEQAEAACAPPHRRRPILLGLQGGTKVVVPVAGLHVQLSTHETALLSPQAVTPFVRVDGGLRAGPDVGFGDPDHLIAAARVVGATSELGVDALRAVLRELARASCPRGAVTARFVGVGLGWQCFHLVEVVDFVRDPGAQLGIAQARALDPASEIGDLLGLSLPPQDWLTPLLLWMRGAG